MREIKLDTKYSLKTDYHGIFIALNYDQNYIAKHNVLCSFFRIYLYILC